VKENKTNVWLYLARRDKRAVRILAKAQGKNVMANRVENIDQLTLPTDWSNKIKQTTFDNRMLWELWIESFDSYEQLKAALTNRGYSNIPMSPQPELRVSRMEFPVLNMATIPSGKTMLKKRS